MSSQLRCDLGAVALVALNISPPLPAVRPDQLIGPNTVNTLPDGTLAAFLDHGKLARTIDASFESAAEILQKVEALGVDLNDVSDKLEREGVSSFETSFENLLVTLSKKAESLQK